MKTSILKHAVFLLFLAGSFYSCAERAESSDVGDVPFELCLRDERGSDELIDVKGEAYLFCESIPDAIKAKLSQRYTAWIVYGGDSEYEIGNIATLHLSSQYDIGTYYICNYPDFAKQWEVSLTGQKVYFEGKAYLLGQYLSVPTISGYDFGLTLLKKN